MPNWSVTSNGVNNSVPAGESTALTLDITIEPSGGYSIAPNNFIIGNAIETDGNGVETLSETNIWEGGNVDNIVQKVEFIQSGNNVLARVYCEAASFVADSDVYIDIDENPNNVVTNDVTGVCVNVDYPYDANSSVTILSSLNTTVQDIQSGSVSANWIKKITRYGDEAGDVILLCTVQVTPASGYHLVDSVSALVSSPPGSEGFISTLSTTSGAVYIMYTATDSQLSLTPCELGNIVYINYTVVADAVASTNTVHGVSAVTGIGYTGGGVQIKVTGDPATQYTITVQNGTTNDYYNWDGTYGSSLASQAGTISSDGTLEHSLYIPASDSNVVYNIAIASVNSSTLATGVPTSAGDMIITQYGVATLTMRAISDTTNFNPLPTNITIVRPLQFSGSGYSSANSTTAIVRGKTEGSSTSVRLVELHPNLTTGMVATGRNIPHNTVIESLTGNIMVLSNAVNIASIQVIKCYSNTADIAPFSFTVVPNGNTLSVNSSNNHANSIFGFNNVQTTSAMTHAGGNVLGVSDARGVVKGMGVVAVGVPGVATVSSVHYATGAVTLTHSPVTTVNSAAVSFKNAATTVYSANITAAMDGVNVVISGYLIIPKLNGDRVVDIFLDDIINVN